MRNILQLVSEVENIEDFIKVSYERSEISANCANEILRLTQEIKDKCLTTKQDEPNT